MEICSKNCVKKLRTCVLSVVIYPVYRIIILLSIFKFKQRGELTYLKAFKANEVAGYYYIKFDKIQK